MMRKDLARLWKKCFVAGAMAALVAGMGSTVPSAFAGGMIKADEDKWISVGMGIRTSFNSIEGTFDCCGSHDDRHLGQAAGLSYGDGG